MYEKTLILEQQSRERKERNYNEQNKTRLELFHKIEISNAILQTLKRKTTDNMIYEPAIGEVDPKG